MSSSTRDAEKFVPKLLDRLRKARAVTNTDDQAILSFKKIEYELQNMTDMNLLPRVKHWEKNLLRHFNNLERRLDKIILGAETTHSSIEAVNGALDSIVENVEQIKVAVPPVQLMPSLELSPESIWTRRSQPGFAQEVSQEWSQLGVEDRIYESRAMANTRRTYEHLESLELKVCFLSFSIFPIDSVIKKRPLIYWWIGEGFISRTQHKTAEEVGEEIFETLLKNDLIQPHFNFNFNASNPNSSCVVVNNCTMHPWIRGMLVYLAKDAQLFNSYSKCRRACLVFYNPFSGEGEDDALTVFNVNEPYLSLKREWLNKMSKVAVLQLGRWQSSPTHHIEVDDEDFLKGLGAHHKQLKYLSLRGISRITQLPSSILKLVNLEILDLRACHNLETLPLDISSLRKLTHFDVSECYLLEYMPMGIEKLTSLQVLKGFMVGTSTFRLPRLGDLAKLKNLKRLSLHIGNQVKVYSWMMEFSFLKEISNLRRLKISWGVFSEEFKEELAVGSLEFPPYLEKLDLQGIPIVQVQGWLKPSRLRCLKKLYIRGGELGSLEHAGDTEYQWTVEILRLKYLSNLEIGLPKLREQFPNLRYLEKIRCHEIEKDLYDEDIVWSEVEA